MFQDTVELCCSSSQTGAASFNQHVPVMGSRNVDWVTRHDGVLLTECGGYDGSREDGGDEPPFHNLNPAAPKLKQYQSD